MTSNNKILITGMGIVSSIGIGIDTFFDALTSGEVGFSVSQTFNTPLYPTRLVGEILDFSLDALPQPWQIEAKNDRFLSFGLIALQEALTNAKLTEDDLRKARTGVVIGTGSGRIDKTMKNGISILTSLSLHSISSQINSILGLQGPAVTFIPACAAGNNAVGYAFDLLRAGTIDIAITGGVDALTLLDFASFNAFKALSDDVCRPFDRDRDGLVLGEGAGILIMESQSHAEQRNADHDFAEIAGYGLSNDAYHIATPNPTGKGAILAMQAALEQCGVHAEEIDYINAHGTATVLNDSMETTAIKEVFGDYAYQVPISSTKSSIGHTLGAAGGIEAAICALAVYYSKIPPTMGYRTPDIKCDLDYVPNEYRNKKINLAMSNSFGFGGHSASIIIKDPFYGF